MVLFFSVVRAKRRFDVRKKMTKLPELEGGGGGYLIWAMPERKRAFPFDVFPNTVYHSPYVIVPVMEKSLIDFSEL